MVSGEDGLASFDRPGQIVIEISRLPIAEKERARPGHVVGAVIHMISIGTSPTAENRSGLPAGI